MKSRILLILNMICLCLLAMLIAAPQPGAPAQERVADGHALDASLRLGSGGYNRRTAGPNMLRNSRYTVGASRSPYVISRTGSYVHSPHNAFAPRGRYRSTGYQGTVHSTGYSRRFRYR